jgi:hypothetical protein
MTTEPTPPAPNDALRQAVEKAAEQAYWDWAAAHPSLATVIDQIAVTQQTASRLRETAEYRQAVAAYHDSRNELNLLNRLLDLVGPIVASILNF